MVVSAPRTPDFYRYSEQPIWEVRQDVDFVVIRWPDGKELRAYALWLFENRTGNQAIDDQTRENMLDPANLPMPDVLQDASVTTHGHLQVEWRGYPTAQYHSGWLRHVLEHCHTPDAYIPNPRIWTTSSLADLPTFCGTQVLSDDEALRQWLATLIEYGVARLRGLGSAESTVSDVGTRIGALRDTNFGTTWSVSVDLEPGSVANKALPLAPHSDLPTRETPPGFQLLHCRVNECVGGLSHMTDGYAVIGHLKDTYPEYYDVLSRSNWIFFNRSIDYDHRWSGPLIDQGGQHNPLTFRTFHPVRAFPDMPEADIPLAYAAMRHFSQLAGSDEFQLRSVFASGDLVAFDNRRILHGRGPFNEDTGKRVLQGAYVDHDEVYSRLRVLTRRNNETKINSGQTTSSLEEK